jgi:hypothetical protein
LIVERLSALFGLGRNALKNEGRDGKKKTKMTAKVIEGQAEALERQQAQIELMRRPLQSMAAVGGSASQNTPLDDAPPSYDHVHVHGLPQGLTVLNTNSQVEPTAAAHKYPLPEFGINIFTYSM